MTGWLQFESSPSRALLRAVIVGLVFCAASIPHLQSQATSGAFDDLTPSATAPAIPSLIPHFGPAAVAPFTDSSGFSTPATASGFATSFKPNFDAGRGSQFGLPRQNAGSQNPFGSFSPGGHRGSVSADRRTATPFEVPSLTQALRKNSTQPLGAYNPKSFNRDAARFGSLFDDSGTHFSSSTMFTNSDLGNGFKFSAGTDFGSHRLPGTPVAGSGPSTPKTNGPSLAFKLSF